MSRSSFLAIAVLSALTPANAVAAPLNWSSSSNFNSAPLRVSGDAPGFTLLDPAATGIRFTNHLSDANAAENQIRLIGSGIALGDVDGDGLCDIYVCGLERNNSLYRNAGNFTFHDITGASGIGSPGEYSTGAALADLDGDGDLDLLVNSLGGGTRLFFNDGKAGFSEAANSSLQRRYGATSMALADVDGDRDLDLYVANYRTNTIRSTGLTVLNVNGRRVVRPEDRDQYEFTPEGLLLEHADPDYLYLNDGKGRFTPLSWTGGAFVDEDGAPLARPQKDWGLSVMFRDMNGDRAPDIYICNDFWSPDRIWINAGQGRFRALPRLAMRNSSSFSMGVDFADINRDGHDDFFVLDMLSRDHARRMRQRAMTGQNFNKIDSIEDRPQVERNTLYLNRGDGSYAEIAQLAGVQASEWSWGVAFIDVDLDGWEDALVTTGHGFDTQDSDTEDRINAMGPLPPEKISGKLLYFPRLNVPNVAFRNRGDLTFEEASARWNFNLVGVSHGIALGDLDNDGDCDVVVNNLNAPLSVYRNNGAAPRIAVRLKGLPPNTRGIGARITISEPHRVQSQEMISGGRYLSSDDPVRTFAAPEGRFAIAVTWRDGKRSFVDNAEPNRVYEILESAAQPPTSDAPRAPVEPLFSDASDLVQHTHHEEPFNDFMRQPTLPRKLSQPGPGVAWFDIDGNGTEDLVIGSGRGGPLNAFHSNGRGRFDRAALPSSLAKAAGDQMAIIGWSGSDESTWFVSQSNYETGETNVAALQRYTSPGRHAGRNAAAGGSSGGNAAPPASVSGQLTHQLDFIGAAGPLAVTDIDADGDLDLFAGAHVTGGRYPEAGASRLFRRNGQAFETVATWPDLGIVNSALFTDLNADGFSELLLACEWGPIRVFRNDAGRFSEATDQFGLSDFKGWWNGIATADFDADGRLDIVASNWGRNTPWQSYLPSATLPSDPSTLQLRALRLYFGDLADSGGVELVEAYVPAAGAPVVPWRDLQALASVIPAIRERIKTSAAYGEATLEQVLGPDLKRARMLTATWLQSTVFLNRGARFEPKPLPLEAQFAPAFGVCTADFDGDGSEDIFLAQNFFPVNDQTSRYDAGRGLLLKGNGKGEFAAVPGRESGLRIYGEQRGAAVCDYDGDGRSDLVVAQNAAATRLYHNDGARPGLRIRLKGPSGNPHAFGAAIRVVSASHTGPLREVQGCSGYLSQNSAVQVIAVPPPPAGISVRWPGGKETVSEIPDGAKNISIDSDGAVAVLP